MSCQHGNHHDACDECDALDEQYNLGFDRATAKAQAKITELETKLTNMAALVAKKDEALTTIKNDTYRTESSGRRLDKHDLNELLDMVCVKSRQALAITDDSVEVVEVEDYALVNGAMPINTKLYTIKVKP